MGGPVNGHCFAVSLVLMFAFPSDRPSNFLWDKILVSNGSVFSLLAEIAVYGGTF